MSERLHITGRGSCRLHALQDAERQAEAYFRGSPFIGEVGDAYCEEIRTFGGDVVSTSFVAEVTYRHTVAP